MARLTHFDEGGAARMVDVGGKPVTRREARARGRVLMAPETLELIRTGGIQKGDVLGVARLAAIMAAKATGGIVPLCHPLPLDGVEVDFRLEPGAAEPAPDAPRPAGPGQGREAAVEIEATVRTTARTGAEMEALTAVAVAGLTIYDMCKAADRAMVIDGIRLVEKAGGRSGHWRREER